MQGFAGAEMPDGLTRDCTRGMRRFTTGIVRTPRTHCVRYLNNFSWKRATFEPLVNTVPWWRLLGEELWQGVRAPFGELKCIQCSNRLTEHKLQACQQGNLSKDMAQAKSRCTCIL